MLPETHYVVPTSRRTAKLRGRMGLCLVATLSFLAGMTDAIGFTAAGDFVSFMSGNTTRLAVSLANGGYPTALSIAMLIFAFIVGNALGAIFTSVFKRQAWPLLCCIGTLLSVASLLPTELTALVLAVLSMGMINAVVEEVNGVPIGLTYVTGALSRFGRGLGRWLMGQQRLGWRVQLVPWTGMFMGALFGAYAGQRYSIAALAVSGALALGLAFLFAAIPQNWQSDFMQK